jgi:hypothetical protein
MYKATDWAMERSFVGAMKLHPDAAVVNIDNARVNSGDQDIASGFLEGFVTTPKVILFSTGTGIPVSRKNDLVLAIITNEGCLSTDLANRAIPIHLVATGNVEDRASAIGNPLEEFLPANEDRIEAELRGMIQR